MIKTFRGLLADGGQDRIRLGTIKGQVGYRIIKFEGLSPHSETDVESSMKIYKTSQSTIDNVIDFTDTTLLAAMIYNDSASNAYGPPEQVIFDQEIFNQDIYITLKGSAGVTSTLNYYIELEVTDLSEMGAQYTTLKDIRAQTQ